VKDLAEGHPEMAVAVAADSETVATDHRAVDFAVRVEAIDARTRAAEAEVLGVKAVSDAISAQMLRVATALVKTSRIVIDPRTNN
jgi:hypothetical protein